MSAPWLVAVIEAAGALVVGALFYFLVLKPLIRRLIRRSVNKGRPPKGARPEVRLEHDGVTYDLTDRLLRVADAADGDAVWVVRGPQHLRMVSVHLSVSVGNPVPMDTELRFEVIWARDEPTSRFMTDEELIEKYPELAGQLH